MSLPLTLRLYTDFACPYCFIAEQSTVPRLLADFELDLDWCGFELHPDTPPGGLPLSRLFPGVDLSRMHERTRRFGAGFGVATFSPPDRLQNTRRALAVAELARDRDVLPAFRAAAFEAHWRGGANLEADDDLARIASTAGLDADEALRASVDPALLTRVDQKQAQARRAGVRGIPTFIIGKYPVVGCQPYEVLVQVAHAAGAQPRS